MAEFLVFVVCIGLFCGALALAGWLAEMTSAAVRKTDGQSKAAANFPKTRRRF